MPSKKSPSGQLMQDLDFLACEAQALQQQIHAGAIRMDRAEERFDRFAAEVERLARSGVRHLRLVPTAQDAHDPAVSRKAA